MTHDLLGTHDLIHAPQINIVQILPDEWTVLRDLKLRSLDQEPIAFAEVEQERAKYLARSEERTHELTLGVLVTNQAKLV